jgi:hypothetical protein
MKQITFITSIEDWTNATAFDKWEEYTECLTYQDTEQAINNEENNIITTSMIHFSIKLIDKGYNIWILHEGKMKRIFIGKKLKNKETLKENENIIELYQKNLI